LKAEKFNSKQKGQKVLATRKSLAKGKKKAAAGADDSGDDFKPVAGAAKKKAAADKAEPKAKPARATAKPKIKAPPSDDDEPAVVIKPTKQAIKKAESDNDDMLQVPMAKGKAKSALKRKRFVHL